MAARHRALEEEDIALIDRVKLMPSLYDPRDPNFRLTFRKEQDWESISTALGLSSGFDARRRWTVLRDRYSRELKQFHLHPERGDLGKNDFFRLMDFLRKFVRMRRERRSKQTHKHHECSWDGTSEDVKMVEKLAEEEEVEEIHDDEVEHEEEHASDDVQHEFVEKVETADATNAFEAEEEYPEYVDDTPDAYEEYVDEPTQVEVLSSNDSSTNTKTIHNTQLIPMQLPQTNRSSAGASYTITTTNMPAVVQPLQQQQPQQSHQQQQSHQPHHHQQQQQQQQHQHRPLSPPNLVEAVVETEDYFFCKSIAAYLRQLSRRHKIKAKVEMFQILEKYIELEESAPPPV